jgi:uncharacterized protein (DUF1697 family)
MVNRAPDIRVALLRGINVGRAKRVAMADLRALVEDLGYRDVRTLLNSGNVIFTVPGTVRGNPASRIEEAFASVIGFTSRVMVVTAAEVAAAVLENPLGEVADNPSRLQVGILADHAHRTRLEPLVKEHWAPEALALGTRVAYLWCPRGGIDSPLMAAAGRVLGDAWTVRTMATVTRIHALMAHA